MARRAQRSASSVDGGRAPRAQHRRLQVGVGLFAEVAFERPAHAATADDESGAHALGDFGRVLRAQRLGRDLEGRQVAQARQHRQRIGAQCRVTRLHGEALERGQQLGVGGTRVLREPVNDRAAFSVGATFEDLLQRRRVERGVDRQQDFEQGRAHFGVAVRLLFVEPVQRRQLQALFVLPHAAQQR